MAKKIQGKQIVMPTIVRSELDRKGVPKSMRGRRLDQTNYYHTLWNWFGRTYNTRVQIN